MSRARLSNRLVHGALLVLIAAYSLFPIYMIATESLKSVDEDVHGSPLFVARPELRWYRGLFETANWVRGGEKATVIPFVVWLKNTGIVFSATLALILTTSVAGGYALGRLRPPAWRWWRRALLATYVLPQTLLFLPLYSLVFRLGLDNSLLAIILVYPMLAIPFCLWLFSGHFQKLPVEIEESAYVEGAGRFRAFARIVLPMSWPVIAAAGIFALGVISSDFMLASVFLPNQFQQTLAVGLGTMDVGLEDLSVVAGVNLVALAVVPLCAVFAGAYVRGLTAAMLEGA